MTQLGYQVEDYIETASGRVFDLPAPHPANILLEDVAHGLAKAQRFGGQMADLRRHYSVAEHSLLMLRALKRMPEYTDALGLEVLLHDAAEAYLLDIPAPIKRLLPDYKALEAQVEAVLRPHFRLPNPPTPLVKLLDRRIVLDERAQVMANSGNHWCSANGLEPLGVRVRFLTPLGAYNSFLRAFHPLWEKVHGAAWAAA